MADENTDQQTGTEQQDDTEQGKPNGDNAQQDEVGQDTRNEKPAAEGAPERKAGESDADWKARSRTWEDRAKANKKTADDAVAERDQAKARLDAVLKALDPDAGKDDDPAETAKKAISERDQHLAELKAERLERAAEKTARLLDVDEIALLDSRGFVTALAKLDPSADGFADDLKAAINSAVDANARLKNGKKTAPPPAGGRDMAGERGGGRDDTPADGVDARRAAYRKSRGG